MARVSKYACNDCKNYIWALGNPLMCERCAGIMSITDEGIDIPTDQHYDQRGGEIVFDWDEFNAWWWDVNVE